MENKLSIKTFEKGSEKLIKVYNYNATKEQMKLYYEHLKDEFTDIGFNNTVIRIIKTEIFFPSVATFLNNKVRENARFWKAF